MAGPNSTNRLKYVIQYFQHVRQYIQRILTDTV